jgi:hypothetical protein
MRDVIVLCCVSAPCQTSPTPSFPLQTAASTFLPHSSSLSSPTIPKPSTYSTALQSIRSTSSAPARPLSPLNDLHRVLPGLEAEARSMGSRVWRQYLLTNVKYFHHEVSWAELSMQEILLLGPRYGQLQRKGIRATVYHHLAIVETEGRLEELREALTNWR